MVFLETIGAYNFDGGAPIHFRLGIPPRSGKENGVASTQVLGAER